MIQKFIIHLKGLKNCAFKLSFQISMVFKHSKIYQTFVRFKEIVSLLKIKILKFYR